jgi:hypothetical protein
MSDNFSQNKQWPDPKDYGLPYVEVTPLNSVVNKEPVSEKELPEEIVVVPNVPAVEKPVQKENESEPILETKSEKTSVEDKDEEPEILKEKAEERVLASVPKETVSTLPTKKKNNSWVPIVLILAVLIISVIVWQLMSQGNESQPSENQLAQQETPKVNNTAAQPTVENTPTEETQITENQDSIPESNSSLEEPVETPQTGTTIDRTSTKTLIRVENKSDRPQYFIVVGSLPNERMAISESEQYMDRASSIYIIIPYEDVKNYRLAIGSFTSFRKASEELETVKDQYTEALWILKY